MKSNPWSNIPDEPLPSVSEAFAEMERAYRELPKPVTIEIPPALGFSCKEDADAYKEWLADPIGPMIHNGDGTVSFPVRRRPTDA